MIIDLRAKLSERLDCLDGIVDKMVVESTKSDELHAFIACAICTKWLIRW